MELIYTCISKLVIYLTKKQPDLVSEQLKHYADPNDYNRIFYHQRNDDMESIIQTLPADSDCLLKLCKADFEDITEYQLFTRCLSDQTIVENERRRLKTEEDGTRLLKCTAGYEPVSQRYMEIEEFSNLARIRNGVETIPSNIRRNYHLDKLPGGKQRGKFFFGSKMAALYFRKLSGFRKSLGNYAQNPILTQV